MGNPPLPSAQWLNVTLHSIGDAVIATDRDAKITFMNPVAESLTGWSVDDATGVPLERVFNIVNEETRQTVESPVEKALRQGTVVALANHTLLIAKDGAERPIDDSAAPILDETGIVVGVVLVFRDISKQREAEKTRASLAAIVESSEDAIISKNLDGVIQTWNAGAERIFGYSAQEANGRSISILIPPDRADEEPHILGRIRRGERVEHYETVRCRKDGGLVDISLSVSPVLDAAGRVSGASKIARDITDRKSAAAHLAHQHRVFDTTLSFITDFAYTFDRDGRFIYINKPLLDLWGLPLEEAVGKNFFDLQYPDELAERLQRQIQQVFATGRRISDETSYTSATGEGGYYQYIFNPVFNADGEVDVVAGSTRDITDFKRGEEALRESERRFRELIDALPAAIYTTDADGRLTHFNPAAAEAAGRTPELGTDEWCVTWKLFRPDGTPLPHAECPMGRSLKEGRDVRGEQLIAERPDGTQCLLEAYPTVLRDDEGRITGGVNLLVDITDHNRAKEALRESEERYRRLFESAKDGILILDAETMRVTDANPFMTELLGYSKEQFEGKELWEIGLFQDKAAIQSAIRELGETGYIRWNHLPLESDQGKIQEIELIGNVYRENDQIVAQCNIRDITDRRELERKLEDQAQELAEADRRKDEFLAMLSHELRNPLTPIFNALQILELQQDGDSEQAEARKVIARQVRQMANLVDDLLDVSRITTGRTRLQRERVEVNAMIEQAVETIRSRVESKEQKLSVTLCPEAVWLDADPTRLGQIMANLLTNAYKYTEPGGHIWLSAAAEDREVVIRVRDDGVGVPPESLPRIFEIFTQVDSSLERSEGGLGIGLALVKRLVDMHEGTVEAHGNGDGRGSEFVVRLPLASESKATPHETPKPASRVGSPPSENGAGLRILVVDDNADAAKMSAILLRNSGHDVRVAHTGPDALELAIDFIPQVVLLDIGLPGMDGYEVARRFRKNPQLADVTLVALTGYGQESDREHSREAGCDHHLVKPVEHAVVTKLLSELLFPQTSQVPASRTPSEHPSHMP